MITKISYFKTSLNRHGSLVLQELSFTNSISHFSLYKLCVYYYYCNSFPQRSGPSSFPSRQFYTEQLRVSTTELLVSMHTTSQLPQDLQQIKKRLGFPLVQFESPIILQGFHKSHMLGTPHIFMDAIAKHYKKVKFNLKIYSVYYTKSNDYIILLKLLLFAKRILLKLYK